MTFKKITYDKQDNKGQHLKDGKDASQKQEIFSHQVTHGSADSLCLSPPAINPSFLLAIYLFSSWTLDINSPKSCHNMSSRGIPQLQQNDLVSMKWMDKEIKHKDFSQCFLRMPEFAVLPGFRFPFGCLHKKNVSLQVKAAFVCSIHLNFLHELITLLDFSSLCLYKESASGGRSAESPQCRNSCHKLRFEAEPKLNVLKNVQQRSETAPRLPCPLWCDWLLLRGDEPAEPLRVSVCRNHAGLASLVRSCSLKPELKHDVVIPAGETALARSGALSQRAAGVTVGPSTFITPLQLCSTAPSSTALFIDLQMWVLLRR